jgi:hypothetical protein
MLALGTVGATQDTDLLGLASDRTNNCADPGNEGFQKEQCDMREGAQAFTLNEVSNIIGPTTMDHRGSRNDDEDHGLRVRGARKDDRSYPEPRNATPNMSIMQQCNATICTDIAIATTVVNTDNKSHDESFPPQNPVKPTWSYKGKTKETSGPIYPSPKEKSGVTRPIFSDWAMKDCLNRWSCDRSSDDNEFMKSKRRSLLALS